MAHWKPFGAETNIAGELHAEDFRDSSERPWWRNSGSVLTDSSSQSAISTCSHTSCNEKDAFNVAAAAKQAEQQIAKALSIQEGAEIYEKLREHQIQTYAEAAIARKTRTLQRAAKTQEKLAKQMELFRISEDSDEEHNMEI